MNILIIGSKGFIGSYIYHEFAHDADHYVVSCDVVQDYNTPNYFVIDSTNTDFSIIFRRYQFDICINCSGAASVPDSINNPLRDFQLNTVNVYKLLEAIRLFCPTCRFVTLSSAAVYGNPSFLPIGETHKLSPLSPYGKHKLYAEQICDQFSTFYGIDVCSLRVFSAYGVGLRKQLLWDLYKKSKNATTIELWGTGDESRDFIEVRDIVEIIKLLTKVEKFSFPILNVANGEGIKIRDLTVAFFESLQKKVTIKFNGEVRAGDPQYWQADIAQLQSIGYTNKINIAQGLNDYCTWLKQIESESGF